MKKKKLPILVFTSLVAISSTTTLTSEEESTPKSSDLSTPRSPRDCDYQELHRASSEYELYNNSYLNNNPFAKVPLSAPVKRESSLTYALKSGTPVVEIGDYYLHEQTEQKYSLETLETLETYIIDYLSKTKYEILEKFIKPIINYDFLVNTSVNELFTIIQNLKNLYKEPDMQAKLELIETHLNQIEERKTTKRYLAAKQALNNLRKQKI